MPSQHNFADSGRLLARVAHAVQHSEKVTFLFGSALTAPVRYPGEPGVPDAKSLVEQALESFENQEEYSLLASEIQAAESATQYQKAMQFIIDCRGQDALNRFITDAVLNARTAKTEAKEL
jgi:hypothetical protein